jgi:hypothetical protein
MATTAGQALEAAGEALAASGNIAGAATRFTDALALYAELGAEWDAAHARAALQAHDV